MMSYVVAGLVTGAIYALSSLGIVLTYNASRVFNFAQGSMAFFIAYCFHWLHTEQGLPIPLALILSVLVIGPALGFVLWAVLLGRLSSATPMVRLAAMIGLSVALAGLTQLIFGDKQVFQPKGIVGEPRKVLTLAGVAISNEQLIVLGVAAMVALAGYLVLERTRAGLVTRGTVDSELMTVLTGTNPSVVVAGSWMVGVAVAGLAGILIMPQVGLNAGGFSAAVAASFAGVVIGRLTNLWVALLGSLLIGVVQSIVVPWLPESGFLATSLRPSLPFLVMALAIVVLRLRSSGIGEERQTRDVASMASSAERNEAKVREVLRSTRGRWDRYVGFAALAIVIIATTSVLSDFWVGVVALGMAYSVALLSFRLVTGEAGIIGLCQIAFVGIGAVAAAQLATVHGLPVVPSMLLAAVIAAICGALVGSVALSLGQLYAAILTYAFALLADQVVFTRPEFSNYDSGVILDRPRIGGLYIETNAQFFYFATAIFLGVAALLWVLRRSSAGLKFATIRSSHNRAASLGLSIFQARLILFALGAGVAGLGGSLMASYQLVAFPGGYSAVLGLTWFAVLVAQGAASIGGAAAAGLSLAVAPALFAQYLPPRLSALPAILFGLLAIQVVINPIGINLQLRAMFRELAIKLSPVGPVAAHVGGPGGPGGSGALAPTATSNRSLISGSGAEPTNETPASASAQTSVGRI